MPKQSSRAPKQVLTGTVTRTTVTIADIAHEAGVHPASVSRALRGINEKVSVETRERIEKIARKLGYRHNAVAASLRTKRTNLVGIVVPDLGNPLFGPIVCGLESELRATGLMCLIVQTPDDPRDRRSIIEALANRQVAGLVVLAAEREDPMLDAAKDFGLPTVLINRGFGERRFSCVVNDDRESVRLVLDHLQDFGHRHIAHVAGPLTSSTGRARHDAFMQMSSERALHTDAVEATAFTREAGRVAARDLLSACAPTAIFAANDLIAMGTYDALRERGLEIPRQVSVVGHNDMPFVDLIDPPLTTVHVAIEQMSRQGAQLLIDLLQMPGEDVITRVLTPRLVVRASTGAAAARPASRKAPGRKAGATARSA